MNPQLGHLRRCSSSGGYAPHVLKNILFRLQFLSLSIFSFRVGHFS